MFDPGWPSNQVSGCTSGLVVQQLVFLPLKRENAGLLKLHFCKDFGAKLLVDRLPWNVWPSAPKSISGVQLVLGGVWGGIRGDPSRDSRDQAALTCI